MLRKETHVNDVVLKFGTPNQINNTTRTLYYHSPRILSIGTDTIIILFPSATSIVGAKQNHYLDLFHEFKFDDDWTLLGVRMYRIERSKDAVFSDATYNDYQTLLHDFFVVYQLQKPADPLALWPEISGEKPWWVKYKRAGSRPSDHSPYFICDPLHPNDIFDAFPDIEKKDSTLNPTARSKGRHKSPTP